MDEQAASSLIGVVLMVAVVVVLGGVVAGFGLGYAEELTEPAPTAAETAGNFNYTGTSTGCDEDQVEFTHQGGDAIDVSELEIVVRTPDNPNIADARIFNLPTSGQTFDNDEHLDDPDNIVHNNCVRGAIANDDGQWSAGERIKFELNAGGGDIDPGDGVEIIIIHEPSGTIAIEQVFIAGG